MVLWRKVSKFSLKREAYRDSMTLTHHSKKTVFFVSLNRRCVLFLDMLTEDEMRAELKKQDGLDIDGYI